MAPSHGVYDYGPDLVHLFSSWLYHLSCARWREIFRIQRLAGCGLLPHARFACPAGVCNVAAGDFDTDSGFSTPMGPSQADRALDGADLALRLYHRGARVFNALQMVPSGNALIAVALRCPQWITRADAQLPAACFPARGTHAREPMNGNEAVGQSETANAAVGYAKFYSRSHDAVIRVCDAAGNVIETHGHKGD